MKLTKMQGLGNDYLYCWGEPENVEELSIRFSNRHFGIGSDGIITIDRSDIADFKMRIFNADGSEAKMCGNGIRCVGKYVYEKGITDKEELHIETLSGVKTLHLQVADHVVTGVTVEMGKTEVSEPVCLNVLDQKVTCTPVSMGNPHAVIFVEDAENAPLTTIGAALEKHAYFQDGANVEFAEIISPREMRMRVWERGSGITMACGTGTCASVAAAIYAGLCPRNEEITVHLDGGDLKIIIDQDDRVKMYGPAAFVCECEV